MRNVKKFLALVLAMLMVVSAAATVSAFEDVAEDNLFAEAIADLTVLEIVNGYDGETFGPEDAVTRQQFALMMARAITGIVGDDAVWAQGGLVGFEDVTEYQYAIATVVKAGIVDGFLDNTFRPDEGVTFIQALKMAVAALGYDDGNLDWWQGYYNVALDLGLTKNLNQITDADKALNRGEVAQLVWNMLYAPAANGSSLAYDVFGIGVEPPVEEPDVLTTFIITATDEQTAAAGMDVTEGGFVGVQQLVNGVAIGDVYYIENEAFGFEDDEDEDAFLSAYDFVNWNDGEFDEIIPTGDSWVIYNSEITTSSNKFKYVDANYYPVDELTGTKIRNEVVIYNASSEGGYIASNKQLFLNAKGEVLGTDGKVVLEAVYSVTGDIVSYLEVSSRNYLSIAAATEKYGVVTGENVVPFDPMSVSELTGAYVLTVYDDDMDGEMDRAYYAPVYLDGYKLSSGKPAFGPMKGKADVEFSEELATGDVLKYTYNEQLNEVTVLETYDVQTGRVDRISTIYDNSAAGAASQNYYAVKITVDGTTYVMGNTSREAKGLDGFDLYTNAPTANGITALLNKGTLGYTYEIDDEYNSIVIGDFIRFVAVDDTIVVLEEYDINSDYELAVLDRVTDYDTEALYMDLWINGALEKDVAITSFWMNDKNVDIADLNVFEFTRILSDFAPENVKGNVYRIVETAEGYRLSEAFVNSTVDCNDNYHDVDNCNADRVVLVDNVGTKKDPEWKTVTNEFGLAYLDYNKAIVFDDGVAYGQQLNDDKALRTDANTVFYFIKSGKLVHSYVGMPRDGAMIYLNSGDVQIYADAIGYNNDNEGETADAPKNGVKGVADVVLVYYTDAADIRGFSVGSTGEKVVYISDYEYSTWYQHDDRLEPSDYGYATELGLGNEYGRAYFYLYDKKVGYDMHTGDIISGIYTEGELVPGAFYVLDNNNVVVDMWDDEEEEWIVNGDKLGFRIVDVLVSADDIDDGKRWSIDPINVDFETLKMIAYNADLSASGAVKVDEKVFELFDECDHNDNDDLDDDQYVVYTVEWDYQNDIFAGVVKYYPDMTVEIVAAEGVELVNDYIVTLYDEDGDELKEVTVKENDDYVATIKGFVGCKVVETYGITDEDGDKLPNTLETKATYTSETNTVVITVSVKPASQPSSPTWTANTSVTAAWGDKDTQARKAELASDFNLSGLTGKIKIYKNDTTASTASYEEVAVTVKVAAYNEETNQFGAATECNNVTATYTKGVLDITEVLKPGTSSIDFTLKEGVYKVRVTFEDVKTGASNDIVFEMSI